MPMFRPLCLIPLTLLAALAICPVALAATVLRGSAGPDFIQGSSRDEQILALGGNDWIDGRGGNDLLDGGAGTDVASYASARGTVQVSLMTGKATGASGSDRLVRIENMIGSPFADQLTGSIGANRIDGGVGNDVIRGGAGNDTLIGGAGNDTIDGGAGNDKINGNAGTDRLLGGSGNDVIYAQGTRGERIDCGAGRDVAYVDKNDTVTGCEIVHRS